LIPAVEQKLQKAFIFDLMVQSSVVVPENYLPAMNNIEFSEASSGLFKIVPGFVPGLW
jgi:hypothetical protein